MIPHGKDEVLEALVEAAALNHPKDTGFSFSERPQVRASKKSIANLKARVICFLQNVPEDMSLIEVLDILRGD